MLLITNNQYRSRKIISVDPYLTEYVLKCPKILCHDVCDMLYHRLVGNIKVCVCVCQSDLGLEFFH